MIYKRYTLRFKSIYCVLPPGYLEVPETYLCLQAVVVLDPRMICSISNSSEILSLDFWTLEFDSDLTIINKN